MKINKPLRIFCALLAVFMIFSMVAPFAGPSFAETPAEKKARLEKELAANKKLIEENKDNIAGAQQQKKEYQNQYNIIVEQIELIKQEIAQKEDELDKKQQELEKKLLEFKDQEEGFKSRLVAMHIQQHTSNNLTVLLGLTSFSEVLRYSENLQRIATSDIDMLKNLREQQQELERQEQEVQTTLEDLNDLKAEQDAKTAELANNISAQNKAISVEQAELAANEEVNAELQEQYRQSLVEWAAWMSDESGLDVMMDEGDFFWPVPGYYRISSDYGVARVIYGVRDVHRGLDIPAPSGTPVYAAASGIVSTKAHWSYGTCVKISHGGGHVTIYGHLSARAKGITDGVMVVKGQLIGYVGSTGNSTGNHLHFELDINNVATSARPYLDPNIVAKLHY